MRPRSIRGRLALRLTIVLLTISVVTTGGLYAYLRGELIEQYDDALDAQAQAVAALWQADATSGAAGPRIARAFPDLRLDRRQGDYLRIADGDNTTVLQLPAGHGEWDAARRPAARRRVAFDLLLPDGRRGRAVQISFDRSMNNAASRPRSDGQTLVLAEGREEMDQTLASLAAGLLIVSGGLSGASIGLVLAVVRREMLPLGEFSEKVGDLDVHSLAYRFPVEQVVSELRPVAFRLNDLLSRLNAAFGRERRFTGNAAHELRTPLAELRTMVEVAMRWPPDPDSLRRHHEQVLGVVQRMSSVTQTLLRLARSESMQTGAVFQRTDLAALVTTVASTYEPVMSSRGVSFEFQGPADCFVLADTDILLSLLDNLFSNASLYSVPGSRIVCTLSPASRLAGPEMALDNAVTDLNVEDLQHMSEPFWRKDAARTAGDHAGLGLALVREYANVLAIDLAIRMSASDRLAVGLAFPTTDPNVPAD